MSQFSGIWIPRRVRIGSPPANKKFYLSTIGPFGNGQDPSQPLDASTQPKLDAIWLQYMNQGSSGNAVSFYYAPGLYQTKGAHFNRPFTAYAGNYHYGSGQAETTIQLVGASDLTQDGVIFGNFGQVPWVSHWGCFNMTLDCNSVNQPKWTGSGGKMAAVALAGGDNITIQNVTVINCGTATMGFECFPIGIAASGTNSQARRMFNILIDSCTISNPPSGNLDGTSSFAITDNFASTDGHGTPTPIIADSTCIISNCQFLDLEIGSGFSYVHCAGAPTVLNCFARNSQVFFYLEPTIYQYAGSQITVKGNICQNMNRLVYVLFHVGGTNNAQLTNLLIDGNTITYPADTSVSTGISLTGGGVAASPIANVNDITIRNNQFISNATQVRPFGISIQEGGHLDMTIQEVDVLNNYFQSFSVSDNRQIVLDSNPAIIVKQSVSGNQFPSPLP